MKSRPSPAPGGVAESLGEVVNGACAMLPPSAMAGGGSLASARGAWQGTAMAQPRSSAAGGFLVAAGAMGGATIGFVLRQPTLWFLGGIALGTAGALLIWWRGR